MNRAPDIIVGIALVICIHKYVDIIVINNYY